MKMMLCRGLRLGHLVGRRSAVTRPLATATYTRDPRFAALTPADVEFFRSALSPRSVVGGGGLDRDDVDVQSDDDVAPYNVDWLGQYRGKSQLALRPRNVDDVRTILARCNERRLAVTPQGGNTGLVGGGVSIVCWGGSLQDAS